MKKLAIALAILVVLLLGGAFAYWKFAFDRPAPLACTPPLEPRCLAEAAAENGRPDALARLLHLDSLLPGPAPDDAILDALAASGDAEAASALAEARGDPAARAAAYRRLAVDAARAGDAAHAKAAAAAAAANVELLGADSPLRVQASGDAAFAAAAAGDVAGASERLSASAGSATVLAEGPARDAAFASLAPALAVVGKGAEALDIARKIQDPKARDDALLAVAIALSAASDPLADKAVSAISDMAKRVAALCRTAVAAAAAGQSDAALGSLGAASALAAALPAKQTDARDTAYGALALAQAQLGDIADAQANLQQVTGELAKLPVLTEIAARQSANGDSDALKTIDQAQAIVTHLKGTPDFAAAQGWLAAAQAALGDGDGALVTLAGIESRRARAFALARVATALARAGAK